MTLKPAPSTRVKVPRRLADAPHPFIVLVIALVLILGGSVGCSSAAASGGSGQAGTDGAESPITAPSTNDKELVDAPDNVDAPSASAGFDYAQVPAYSGAPYAIINDSAPELSADDAVALLAQSSSPVETEAFSSLDQLGRCGVTMAVVSRETQPTGPRGSIGMVKPSGWHTVRYDDLVDGKYLYNRCHLIGYQLTGEGANELNLITGTRYMNTQGMLPFENWIDDCVDAGGRVLLRVEPVFVGDELVARGVHMEALSLDDGGAAVSFNVFCYNVQPGISIDYATGDSWRTEEDHDPNGAGIANPNGQERPRDYVLNTNTGKFHLPGCKSVSRIKIHNKQEVTMARSEVVAQGYEPCAQCNP